MHKEALHGMAWHGMAWHCLAPAVLNFRKASTQAALNPLGTHLVPLGTARYSLRVWRTSSGTAAWLDSTISLNDERLWIGMTPAITGSCSNATWHTGSNTTGLRDLSRIPPFTVHLMRHAAHIATR